MLKSVICVIFSLILAAGVTAQEISVTVYNSDLGVISETRTLDFQKGIYELAFRDVPSKIDANSVQFEVIGGEQDVAILEQNYVFDLISPDQMYRKYIDQAIDLVGKEGQIYSGQLLAFGSGAVTLQDKDGGVKIVSLDNITEVNFPVLPEGLITRPTLFWRYQSNISGDRECRVGYQTSGMNWTAEYIGLLDKDEKNLDLSGWAAINNTSGKTYKDATLKLIAGEISRAQQPAPPRYKELKMAQADALAGAGFEEKAFFEYHMYTLPRKATVKDKEIKQISLFEPASTTVDKIFLFQPEKNATQILVAIKFINSEEAGLGMPLPAGRFRMFKTDEDGSMILLGEDQIEHTPREEELKIKVGYAFDIKAEEKTIEQTRVSSKVEERTYEIELRNRKKEPVTIQVEKKLYGYWEMLRADFEYTKKDANTIEFNIPVPADTVKTVDYKVRYVYR
jgi:hypothetical protein